MWSGMNFTDVSRALNTGLVVLSALLLTACNESSDTSVSSATTSSSIVLSPASADIQTSETTQFSAYIVGENNAAIEWKYEGCGWVEKTTGRYHAPTGISRGRKSCEATLTAISQDNPDIKAIAKVKVALVKDESELTPVPIDLIETAESSVNSTAKNTPVIKSIPVVNSVNLQVFPKIVTIDVGTQVKFDVLVSQGIVNWSHSGCGSIQPNKKTYKAPVNLNFEQCRATITFNSSEDPGQSHKAIVTVKNPAFNTLPELLPTPEAQDKNVVGNRKLVVYPAINQFRSGRFTVTATQNGTEKNSFVYVSKNTDKNTFDYVNGYMQEANHWTSFSFEGEVAVTARREDGKKIKSCIIRPKSLGIRPVVNGNSCKFTLVKPANVSVEIDESFTKTVNSKSNGGSITKYVVKHPLFIFANPLETKVPNKNAAYVHYFGPGVHNVGENYLVKNGEHVYVAGGGYVKGTFKNAQKNSNIKFSGRGIISGLGISKEGGYSNHLVHISGGSKSKLSIEGLTFTDSPRAGIETNASADITGVKIFSWYSGSDGIRTGANSTIENSFFKVNDDVIKLYTRNITVRNTVIWQMTKGAAFQLGWQTASNINNVQVSNIDVIHSDAFTDYSGQEKKDNQPDYRSSKAIFSCMGLRNSKVSNVEFTNIRIEDRGLLRLLGMRLASFGPKSRWWGSTKADSKKIIDGIAFKNIYVASTPYRESFLYGNKGGTIKNISFENLVIEGVKSRGPWDLTSKIDGSGFVALQQVSSVFYK